MQEHTTILSLIKSLNWLQKKGILRSNMDAS